MTHFRALLLAAPAASAALWGAPSGPLALADPATAGAADVLQILADEIVLANGSRITDAVLVVADGRVRAVGDSVQIDESLPWFEHEGVITAGFVACQTRSGRSGESRDTTRSLMPQTRLLHAFDPEHSDFERALRQGITTVVLTPAPDNLAGGVTAVVKTVSGLATVIEPEAHLALSFSGSALGHPGLGSAADGGLEYTHHARRGARLPTSYPGAIALLAERFAGGPEDDPFQRAARGELPVLLEAWNRHEVVRAARFAREHGLVGAIRGAPLAGDPGVLAELVASGLGVVLGPFQVGHATRSLEAVARLGEAGVPVAFALGAPEYAPEAFRLSAALALSAGADGAALLASLTSTAARIAGVEDRVGSLAPGLDADFVLWSGDPLNLASRPQAVYVGGELAWREDREDRRSDR